jgi:hypothetical protein
MRSAPKWIRKMVVSSSSAPVEEAITAFTPFGVDNLTELVKMYKTDPDLLRRYPPPE